MPQSESYQEDFLGQLGSAAGELLGNLAANLEQLLEEASHDSREVIEHACALYDDVQSIAHDIVRATPRFARITRDVLHIAAGYRLHASLDRGAAAEVLGAEVS
ncbi:MAG TPA: hypothetical protein VEB21_08280, partial [Terriglobales bacterium]|nr:hypothetical protein [Terriglobales bacterium]